MSTATCHSRQSTEHTLNCLTGTLFGKKKKKVVPKKTAGRAKPKLSAWLNKTETKCCFFL